MAQFKKKAGLSKAAMSRKLGGKNKSKGKKPDLLTPGDNPDFYKKLKKFSQRRKG